MAVAHQNANEAEAHGADHGIGRYLLIWALLLVFTAITVITGHWVNLGPGNIIVALIIATTKATLVVLFFMHLWDMGGVNRLVFVVSVLFAVVLIIGVFGDLMTRFAPTLPNGGPLPPHSAAGAEEAVKHGMPPVPGH
jgi:cytochrome c oxidase subunit 4